MVLTLMMVLGRGTGADDDALTGSTGPNTSGNTNLALNGNGKLGSGKYISITSDVDEAGASISFLLTGKDYQGKSFGVVCKI